MEEHGKDAERSRCRNRVEPDQSAWDATRRHTMQSVLRYIRVGRKQHRVLKIPDFHGCRPWTSGPGQIFALQARRVFWRPVEIR